MLTCFSDWYNISSAFDFVLLKCLNIIISIEEHFVPIILYVIMLAQAGRGLLFIANWSVTSNEVSSFTPT